MMLKRRSRGSSRSKVRLNRGEVGEKEWRPSTLPLGSV